MQISYIYIYIYEYGMSQFFENIILNSHNLTKYQGLYQGWG